MPRLTLVAALSTSLTLAATPASAALKEPVALRLQGNWEMNYDQDACHLIAKFGDAEQFAILRLSRFSPGDAVQMTIYGKMLESRWPTMPIEVSFDPQKHPYKRNGISLQATIAGYGKLPATIVGSVRTDGWQRPNLEGSRIVAPPLSAGQEAQVSSITFTAFRKRPYRLVTGGLRAQMAALRTCTNDLVRHWGYDPEQQARISRPPQPANDARTWVTSQDFPAEQLRLNQHGVVRVRMDVEDNGNPSSCRVLYRTDPDAFADLTCKLMLERAKLAPALDAMGKPIRSYFILEVLWSGPNW